MNSWETIGQMSMQCGSMNSSTTTRPRKLASDLACPAWSVRVNSGAGRAGTGDKPIRLASEVGTLAGIPDGLGSDAESWCWRTRTARYATIAARTRLATVTVMTTERGPRRGDDQRLRPSAKLPTPTRLAHGLTARPSNAYPNAFGPAM